MHELDLTCEMVEMVLEESMKAGTNRVFAIYFSIGEGRDVLAPLLESCFKRLSKGTIAEDAELIISHVPLMVKCNNCDHIYHIDVFDESTWTCPKCSKCDYELHSGMEFDINRIEIE